MADTPHPFVVRVKPRSSGARGGEREAPEPASGPGPTVRPTGGPAGRPAGRNERVELYDQALAFTARVLTVIELAETERYHVRDQLDRKAVIVPQLIAQGLALADMQARRALYQRAREALIDCAAILDILGERGTIEPEELTPARELARALIEKLLALTVPPPRAW
ncbi:MAG TPA: four helix bundle protein [Kofleriaceae bacterium]|nr:four helix bundle protein [Kofleriaceae bacterium]